MGSFNEHCLDCDRLLGDRCEDVNRWMDQWFKTYGPLHRFVNHHTRGIAEAGELFGERGRKAATIHILRDCGFIPKDRDWKEQRVDSLGMLVDGQFVGYWDPWKFAKAARDLIGAE